MCKKKSKSLHPNAQPGGETLHESENEEAAVLFITRAQLQQLRGPPAAEAANDEQLLDPHSSGTWWEVCFCRRSSLESGAERSFLMRCCVFSGRNYQLWDRGEQLYALDWLFKITRISSRHWTWRIFLFSLRFKHIQLAHLFELRILNSAAVHSTYILL